jgi:NAD(P)-dependent dehydrogenase (short-subunit alcohol dehydrogenase family)
MEGAAGAVWVGLRSFGRTVAKELPRGIRVNTISPGLGSSSDMDKCG